MSRDLADPGGGGPGGGGPRGGGPRGDVRGGDADPPSTEVAASEVVRLLHLAGATLGVAESLTGGSLTAAVVGVPGASAVLRGGVVAYATDLKGSLLGVRAALLSEHGAVHPAVVAAMAAGAQRVLGSTWGVATTGVAGPTEQDGHPVGTVHLAVSGPRPRVQSLHLGGSRDEVREGATWAGLVLLIACLRTG